MERLWLGYNAISDPTPLSEMRALRELFLESTGLDDVSPLADLTNLQMLSLAGNAVADIGPLAGMTALTDLELQQNRIADISVLAGLRELRRLDLSRNELVDIAAPAGTRFAAEVRKSDGLRRKILRVGLGDEVRTRRRVDSHVPEDVLDDRRKTGPGRRAEILDVAVVDSPDFDHVVAAPGGSRFQPDPGEHDAGVRCGHSVPDRGLDFAKDFVGCHPRFRSQAMAGWF